VTPRLLIRKAIDELNGKAFLDILEVFVQAKDAATIFLGDNSNVTIS
jgi:hypothetical protein